MKKQNTVVIVLGIGLLLIIGAFLLFKYQKSVKVVTEPEPDEVIPEIKTEPIKNFTAEVKTPGDDEQHT